MGKGRNVPPSGFQVLVPRDEWRRFRFRFRSDWLWFSTLQNKFCRVTSRFQVSGVPMHAVRVPVLRFFFHLLSFWSSVQVTDSPGGDAALRLTFSRPVRPVIACAVSVIHIGLAPKRRRWPVAGAPTKMLYTG